MMRTGLVLVPNIDTEVIGLTHTRVGPLVMVRI